MTTCAPWSSGGPDAPRSRSLRCAMSSRVASSTIPTHGGRNIPTPSALVVRHEAEDQVFATVFGQLITARPGDLALEYSRRPWTDEPWRTRNCPPSRGGHEGGQRGRG